MATTTPLAYNTGSPIAGTSQIGNLAIGITDQDYSSNLGGVPWWMGPDEELGYVIAVPVPSNTQPTFLINPAPSGLLILSNVYIGNDINLSNGNQRASQQFGYQQTVLGETQIGPTEKIMFSVLFNTDSPLTLPDSRFIGVGYTSMNYKSIPPYGAYPGNDNQSVGVSADGKGYYNGAVFTTSLPTWTDNDIVDIAIDSQNNSMWVRVNGGDWNNDSGADPSTNLIGAIEIIGGPFYPALCPGYQGVMTIQNNAQYTIPSGFTLLGENITASIGFYRSDLLTENSFVELTNNLFTQSFTGGTEAVTWLNSNGYWTSYSDTWQYNSGSFLEWTDDTTGYTLLTGGVTANDDGYWINPITIPTYYTNNQTSSSLYVSTNAVITLGVGYGVCCPNSPQTSSNPALISGNAGDMYVNPNESLTDGTIMNTWYRITQNGDKTKIELKVFQAILSAQNSPYSYQLNLYRDSTYQWVETRVKIGIAGNVGPYNDTDVSEPASTISGVWRGDLLGQNWVYLGSGIVIE